MYQWVSFLILGAQVTPSTHTLKHSKQPTCCPPRCEDVKVDPSTHTEPPPAELTVIADQVLHIILCHSRTATQKPTLLPLTVCSCDSILHPHRAPSS